MLDFIKSEREEEIVESSRRMGRKRSRTISTEVMFSYTE